MNKIRLISYLGSKVKLQEFLNEVILKKNNTQNNNIVFHDLFSGTSSVSHFIKEKTKWKIVNNDFLKFSSIISHSLIFDQLNHQELKSISDKLNVLNSLIDKEIETNISEMNIFNELSVNGTPKSIAKEEYKKILDNQAVKNSRMYFSEKVGKHVDLMKFCLKKWLQKNEISKKEFNVLMIFVLSYADRNANTTSMYGAYLKNTKKTDKHQEFLNEKLLDFFKDLENTDKKQRNITITNLDIIESLKNIDKENYFNNIIYLDPPYSTRSYEKNYHILNYICDLDFKPENIKFNSKTAQPNYICNNPFRSKQETVEVFKTMIVLSLQKASQLFISYSTDGLIKQEEIENIYSNIKKTNPNVSFFTFKKTYKRYSSDSSETRKYNNEELQEIIWCFSVQKEF